MKCSAVFLDRDGTLNEEKHYVHRIEEFQWIPGVLEALKLLTQNQIAIYIVTNQAGIAKGIYSEKDFHTLNQWMLSELASQGIMIEQVLYCPHHPEAIIPEYKKECECRKPGSVLIQNVFGVRQFLPQHVALIGDRNSDIEAGRSLGIRTYLVETDYGAQEKNSTMADRVVPSLKEAVEDLLSS